MQMDYMVYYKILYGLENSSDKEKSSRTCECGQVDDPWVTQTNWRKIVDHVINVFPVLDLRSY